MPMPPVTSWQAVVRTCIIDGFIERAVASGIDTVVNLGAGLDARPYRLNLPKTLKWVEVDQQSVIDFKNEILKSEVPRCELERHAINLADDPARRTFLEKIGAQPGRVLVLTEGVIPYLTEDQVGILADELRRLPNIAGWVAEYFHSAVLKYRNTRVMKNKMNNAPFLFQAPDWFGFFKSAWLEGKRDLLPRPRGRKAWPLISGPGLS